MSVDNFTPIIWVARLLAHLDKAFVYGQAGIINRDYKGTIANVGDTVRVGQIGDVTVKPYTKGRPIAAPDEVTEEMLSLTIDQADYFNFAVDDVDVRQSAVNQLDGALQRAGYAMHAALGRGRSSRGASLGGSEPGGHVRFPALTV
jgi:hypothetical protein